MPTRTDLVRVARELCNRMKGKAFVSVGRMEVTELLRKISGEDGTRLKAGLGEQLEQALLEQGIRCFPRFQDTTTGDTIRLFRPQTVIASLVDMLLHPDGDTDKELAHVTTKVKGLWKWGPDGHEAGAA
jgi:chemotaxis protein CheY-P-specific phosphatase CheC